MDVNKEQVMNVIKEQVKEQVVKDAKNVINDTKKDSSLLVFDQIHENIENPPSIPGFDVLTIEPQLMMLLGKLVKLLNDDTLYKNATDLFFTNLNIKVATAHNNLNQINNELPKQIGGATPYFTEEDCSFFPSLSLLMED